MTDAMNDTMNDAMTGQADELDPAARIQQTRARLEQDLAVLQTRLPDRDTATRVAAIAAGGTAATISALWIAWSRHTRARDRRELVSLLREAGLEAVGERVPPSGGNVGMLLAGVAAGLVGAGVVAARRMAGHGER